MKGEREKWNHPHTRLKVLLIEVKNEKTGEKREILAFLDEGADCHLIRRELYVDLGLGGKTSAKQD